MSFEDRLESLRLSLDGDFVPAIVAQEFVDEMAREHPEELMSWLSGRAVQFCTVMLSRRLRQERLQWDRRSGARGFAESAKSDDVSPFLVVTYEIDAEHTRRPLGQMTAADHMFVAARYRESGNRALMLAAFHEAVARKVGSKTTAEALTEEQYERMSRRLLDPSPQPTVRAA